MWPTDRGRRRDASPQDDRDRKRKREKEHTKEDKRDKQDKQDKHDKHEKHEKNDRQDKHQKPEKHSKGDGHYDRGSGDHKKRGEYGYGGEEHRRPQDSHPPARGHDNRDAERTSERNRTGRQGDSKPDDGRQRAEEEQKKSRNATMGNATMGGAKRDSEVDQIPPIEADDEGSKAAKKDWREEMGGAEDERDLSDDEDVTARKLAESRKRREAMVAKAQADKAAKEADEAEDLEAVAKVSSGEKTDIDASGLITPPIDWLKTQTAAEAEGKKEDGKGVSDEQKKEVTNYKLEKRAEEEKAEQGDMFGETADKALNTANREQSSSISLTGASGDDWDDQDGYYCAKIGEVMEDRYLVVENICGKGVFSNVVKAKDQVEKSNGVVAIKVMRANDMMKKAAEKEIEILQILNNADKGRKRHVVSLLGTFYYRKHLCLVFECMWDDLRAALKKYTKNKGMALQAIRAYTKQLMVGLRHMHKCGIIHADIKPDNILISEDHNTVKFCDLGTALEIKDVAISPYLVSRFYRAPEIILGCEYSISVDVFALGATLYELFTGKILFNSKTNNDALRKIMEIKGKIPVKIIKKGLLWKNHFDDAMDFKFEDVDQYTKKVIVRTMTDLNAKKDLFDLLMERVGPEKKTSTSHEDLKTVTRVKQFADLIHQMLAVDPEKRITATDALSHPFLEDRLGSGGDRGSTPAKR